MLALPALCSSSCPWPTLCDKVPGFCTSTPSFCLSAVPLLARWSPDPLKQPRRPWLTGAIPGPFLPFRPVGPPLLLHARPVSGTAHLISDLLGPVPSALLPGFSTAHIAKEPSSLSHVTSSQPRSVTLPAGFRRLLCCVLPSGSLTHCSSQFSHQGLRHTVLNPHAPPTSPCSHAGDQAVVSSRALQTSLLEPSMFPFRPFVAHSSDTAKRSLSL